MNSFHAAWGAMVILATAAAGQDTGVQRIDYAEDTGVFPNPERGFYLYQNLARLGDEVARMRERHLTLLWGKIDLEPFREVPLLPAEFLTKLDQGFIGAQEAGAKVIVRASYGHRGPGGDYRTYEDPPLDVVRGHIEQLQPLFERHADRIALFEAGFIGPWGEWHTTEAAESPDLRRPLFMHLLEHTPSERMVLVRYPALKHSLFGSTEPLTSEEAYSGSPRARTGHHNDCFLSSPTDMGTYNRGALTMAEEQRYLASDTAWTVFGGETCALHARSLPETALAEMERLHLTYLNAGYHPEVLERWRETDLMETIEKRMGARLVLESLELPAHSRPGGEVPMLFTLANRGFAAIYNERPVFLVLRDADGREVKRFALEEIDPRRWAPGECVRFALRVTLPAELEPGSYSWHLHLPDPSPRLAGDPRFAYRFANAGVWDAVTGENRLHKDWEVAEPAR